MKQQFCLYSRSTSGYVIEYFTVSWVVFSRFIHATREQSNANIQIISKSLIVHYRLPLTTMNKYKQNRNKGQY